MFKSKKPGVVAVAALAVGMFGSAQIAQAGIGIPQTQSDGIGVPQTQSDMIAILKAESAASAPGAGGDQGENLVIRKAGGE